MKNKKRILKICGVLDPNDAHLATSLGANRIGIILYPKARRYVPIKQAKMIAKATKDAGGCPVGVFVNPSIEEVIQQCSLCDLQYIQLHGDVTELFLQELPKYLVPTISRSVSQSGTIVQPLTSTKVDYILFESEKSGKGKRFDWERFTPPMSYPWMLAVGLTPENIENAIELLQPDGVDVSTGVESSPFGRKDPKKLKEFIKKVRSYE